MDVKLAGLLLMNCVIVGNCQSSISYRNEAIHEFDLLEDMKSEMQSIRQLLMKLQQTAGSNEKQAIQEMKSEIEGIRRTMLEQNGNVKRAIQEMKSEIITEIRQIVNQPENWSRKTGNVCPFGFEYLPAVRSCYKVMFEEMTWDNATRRCQEIMPGAHLATITSQAENEAIATHLQSKFNGTNKRTSGIMNWCTEAYGVWIGAQKTNERRCEDPYVWKTLNGTEIPFNYTNWASGQPNCFEGEACIHIVSCMNYAWNDFGCGRISYALCEI